MASNKSTPTKKKPVKGKNYSQPNTKKRNSTSKKKKNINRDNYAVTSLSVMISAIILAVFIYFNSAGVIGAAIRNVLFGMFASVAYLIPVVLVALSVYTVKRASTRRFWIKTGLCVASMILLAALIQLMSPEVPEITQLLSRGIEGAGGGIFGGLLAIFLYKMLGKIAGSIIIVVALFIMLSIIFKVSFISVVQSFFKGMSNEIDEIERVDISQKGRDVTQRVARNKERIRAEKEKKSHFYDELAEEYSENGKKSTAKKDKNKDGLKSEEAVLSEKKSQKDAVDGLILEEDILMPFEEEYNFADEKNNGDDIPEEAFDADKFLEEVAAQLPQTEGVREIMEGRKNAEASKDRPQRVATTTEEERNVVSEEIDEAITEVKEYVYPGFDLLRKPGTSTGDKRKEMLETSKKLMEILKNFGVEAKLLQVTNGPAVTRYEIQPTVGTKLSKITGLAEDIALNLAVPTVLVAPVPGKAAVGIEVPNNSIGLVSVREILESDEFRNSKSTLSVALGKDIGGRVIVGDIGKFPHILIAGSTGSGKSVCINTIITSILYKASPEEVKLIMVDPKVVELGVYNGIPHLLIPVVTDPKRAAGALNWAVGEMMKRYELFAQTNVRNLDGYNKLMEKEGNKKLPKIVIIIDELADLMMVAAKEVEDYICRLAQLARAAGIHLIIATQRPSVDVITGLIKANVPSRIAFAVSSGVDSRTILDRVGAEKLLGKGDMLYHPTGMPSAVRVQGAFVNDDEVENVVGFVKQNADDSHYAEDLEEHIDRISTGENGVTEEDEADDADALLPQAIELALELGQISTAMVQRRMKVGYARAGRIIDQMEARGLIGGANGSKPREVYAARIKSSMEPDFLPPVDDD